MGSRICQHKICHVGVLIILSSRLLKNSKFRERICLNSPYLTKGRSSKRNSIVINPSPGSFIHLVRLALLSQERRLEADTIPRPTLSQTIVSPICSSKGSVIFLKSHFLSPKKPIPSPLSTLGWYRKSEF